MVNELVDAETSYFSLLNSNSVVVDRALENNHRYYERLYKLSKDLKNFEEKFEIAQELIYLSEQAVILKNVQLNSVGRENESN